MHSIKGCSLIEETRVKCGIGVLYYERHLMQKNTQDDVELGQQSTTNFYTLFGSQFSRILNIFLGEWVFSNIVGSLSH